jgi:prolyl-tRNA synthetase
LSTRVIGGVIMAHGDDSGLILPPRVAPLQVVVVPIMRSNDPDGSRAVGEAVARIEREAGTAMRLRIDRRDGIRPGEKYAHWELRGVPLRVVVGAKDLAEGRVTVVRRVDGAEQKLPVDAVSSQLPSLLDTAQRTLFERAQRALDERSVDVRSLDELVEAFRERPVFASGPFCNRAECEVRIKESVHALTVRNLRADREADGAPCIACGESADSVALMARAY